MFDRPLALPRLDSRTSWTAPHWLKVASVQLFNGEPLNNDCVTSYGVELMANWRLYPGVVLTFMSFAFVWVTGVPRLVG